MRKRSEHFSAAWSTDGRTHTSSYFWAKVASATRKVSLAIEDNSYVAYLAEARRR